MEEAQEDDLSDFHDSCDLYSLAIKRNTTDIHIKSYQQKQKKVE
jgi:hypothetical protein